jgi:hypothetical protein
MRFINWIKVQYYIWQLRDEDYGTCCCGESMEYHSDPFNCGHSPVDMKDYAIYKYEESLKK